MQDRDLTSLEYIVLGLIGHAPQSGYDIVSFFEDGLYSWSASPGSIYPMLKRLEKQGLITGELEMTYETRPRKVYALAEPGARLLDAWLREVPQMRPFYLQREMSMLRFQFMEKRLPRHEVLAWLDSYIDVVKMGEAHREDVRQRIASAVDEFAVPMSLHAELVMEGIRYDVHALRDWLSTARERVAASSDGEPDAGPESLEVDRQAAQEDRPGGS